MQALRLHPVLPIPMLYSLPIASVLKKKNIDSIILEFEVIPNILDLLAFMSPNLFLANGKGFEIGLGSNPDLETLYKIEENQEFHGGPVIRALHFHGRGPGSGNYPAS